MQTDRTPPAPEPIEFYFDFSSPYAYLALERMIELAARHDRRIRWRPILLGVAFRTSGAQPLIDMPLKGDYLRHDCPRFARMLGLPFVMPDPFPFASVAAARAVYWARSVAPGSEQAVVMELFDAIFGRGISLTDRLMVAETVCGLGLMRFPTEVRDVLAGIEDASIKDALRTETEKAVNKGVFGSPFFIVDGEPFWGADRIDHVDWWLRKQEGASE